MGSALFICDVFLGKDKQAPLFTLDPTHTLSLTPHSHYPFLYHEYPRATLSVYALQCHGWEHGSTLKTMPPTFSTRIYSCLSTAVARFLQLLRYSLYVAHIQWWRSFDNPPLDIQEYLTYCRSAPNGEGVELGFGVPRFSPCYKRQIGTIISLSLAFSKRF